jgi:hypothetical protein
MPNDFWHYYLLLRPLLVFVLAAPLLVLAALFRGHDRTRGSDHEKRDQGKAPGAITGTGPDSAREARVESSPGEWRVSAKGSERRAA